MRPYFRYNLNELIAEYESAVEDLAALRGLLAELERRNSDGARTLRRKVSARILQLMTESRGAESPATNTQRERRVASEQAVSNGSLDVADIGHHGPSANDRVLRAADDDAADVLREIRQRLLDLSRRNPLLNYRHPRGKSLRVIDEVPDQLFERLLNGDTFVFEPLPRVPLEHESMSDEVRQFLESQSNWRRPSRNEWARMHDIEPGFDLPVVGARGRRHNDLLIQTLLFPDELETRLRTMAAHARTAIEESGANILNLAFGFLEWREAEHSEVTSLAPLILIPVTLKKTKGLDTQTRREKFRLEYSGEDLQSNLSLRERLRNDFSLLLPDLEDDDTPEKYFQRCSGLLDDNPTWTIHRFVTLGFFQFGKLLMYLDLDPDRWPKEAPIAEHPLITQILEGASDNGIGGDASIEIDSIPLASPEAQVIESADSSQHQAIIDAASGRNMVIEGPPGTGKSQTITNIIGVCLAQGKSVLFVSEKLAALEVVKSRLEKAGLGDFCLELHSHKTQKRKFLDDLEKRVKRRRRTPPAFDSTDSRKAYEQIRSAISEYLKAVHQPVDGYDLCRRDLFCKVAHLEGALSATILESLSADTQGARLDDADRSRAINLAKDADRVRASIEQTYGDVSRHPWYGLIPKEADAATVDGKPSLEHWVAVTDDLIRHAFGSDAPRQTAELRTPAELGRALEIFSLLPKSVCETFDVGRLSSLDSPTSQIRSWIDQETRLNESTRRAASIWKLGSTGLLDVYRDVAAATELLDAEGLKLSTKSPTDIANIARCLSQLTNQMDAAVQGMLKIEETLGCPCDPGEDGMNVARQLLTLTAQRPTASLFVRQPILEGIRDFDLLTRFAAQHSDLIESRARRSLLFKIDEPVDQNRLKAAESILTDATGLFRFRSDWRSANAVYQELRHKKSFFRSTTQKAKDLRAVLGYLQDKTEFERNMAYAAILGPVFDGLVTRADDILQVCLWYRSIREAVGDEPTSKGIAGERLMRLGEEAYATIDILGASPFSRTCEFVAGYLRELCGLAPAINVYIFANGWRDAAQRAEEVRDRVVHASDRIALHNNDPTDSVQKGQDLLQAVISLQGQPERLKLHGQFLLQPKQDTWSDADIAQLQTLARVAEHFENEHHNSPVKNASVVHASATPDAHEKVNEVGRIFERFVKARQQVDEVISPNERQFFGQVQDKTDFVEIADRLKKTQVGIDQISIWTSLAKSVERIRAITDISESLASVLFDVEHQTGRFSNVVRYVTLARVAYSELRQEPILRRFSSNKHDELLTKFRQMDDRLRQVSSWDICNRLVNSPVPAGQTGRYVSDLTEMALLNREMQKQRRHIPIRKLLHRAGNALIALKPCFMMGPLSVAQYLAPGEVSFDLVVMDEASQMRPEDALGAIARGKQLIVVGDPRQLPPTSFFERLNESDENDEEDQELTFGTQESILDIATPIFGSSRILTWHYRSQHQDLIAFSNHSFYDNNLLLFPTAHAAADHLGVDYHRVEGSYGNKTNEEEAQRLIADVIREIKSGRKRSIGVVAMNASQAQVLRDLWVRNLREMPEIEEIIGGDAGEDVLESLFIKNLENVQGDERDVIFISLTYGRDRNGNFYQRFGPINRDNGWRRLNVLFTRARLQMKVYSSMDSSMIVPGERATRGVVALKDFLTYCETKVLPELPTPTGRGADSVFEEDVARAVRALGLEAEFQIGVVGFFIDIGVYDPREPRHFLMGIECDGAAYHSSQSARDRDKIRQEVLEKLGWNIYRIWSTDWFQKGPQERARLRAALEAVKLEADRREESRVGQAEVDSFEAANVPLRDEQEEATEDIARESQESWRDNLKSRFLDLRKTLEEEFPDVRPENSLLNDDVLAALLRHRPTSLQRFHQAIPLELRQKIDPRQSHAYLSTVMLMLEDAAFEGGSRA